MPKKVQKKALKGDAKKEIIASLSKTLNDKFAVSFANDRKKDFDLISTGNQELDRIITPNIYEERGVAGVPRGFLCEFFGPEAGGKSSLCLMLAADVTRRGGMVLWVDAEGSWVEDWAINHEVNIDNVVIVETGRSGEDYFNAIKKAGTSGNFELIVLDSLASVQPKEIQNADLDKEARIGAVARMMHRVCPQLTATAKTGNCTIVLINQIRHKIVMFGNPETTPGGNSLKFYASLRLRLSQVTSKNGRGITKDDEEIGIRSNVQVVKSRFGPPYRETVLPIYYGKDKPHPFDSLIDLALSTKIIKCRSRRNKETGESIQYFTLDGHDVLKSIAGIDDFKIELQEDSSNIIDIYRRIVEEKGKAVDPEIKTYIDEVVKAGEILPEPEKE